MSKQRRVGKSIEEIMVRRKFDSTDPVTWPDPLQKMTRGKNSTTLPNLEMALTTTSGASSQANITGALHGYSEDDKNKIMNSLMNYCTALQKRVSVCRSIALFIFIEYARCPSITKVPLSVYFPPPLYLFCSTDFHRSLRVTMGKERGML